ncbi:MAG: leucine-rich repeat domain-containing protein [Lachnospiraceae bacterium]|nr:leucine-rich repeat domain-containing protein [Lachnospiraceae bacterium]
MGRHRNYILAVVALYLLVSRGGITCASSSDEPKENKQQHLTYEINDNGEAVITGGNCDSYGWLVIPESIDGYHVVGVADKAFSYSQDIRRLEIEEGGARYIGAYAFAGCRHMDTPSLGKGIQAIGEGAFRDDLFTGRKELERDVFLSDNVMSIGKEAFACCSNLRNIVLPQYADIDPKAFEQTPWQEARDERFQIRGSCLEGIRGNTDPVLEIPYGVTRLGREGILFQIDEVSRQIAYEEIILPDTLSEMESRGLERLRIKQIEIPGTVKELPYGLFKGGEVSKIILSEGTETIDDGALVGINGLETICIPSSIQVIESYAFEDCMDLRRITIPGTVERIGEGVFNGCENLTEVVYEEGIREIGCGYKDTKIKRIQFPESTVSIQGILLYARSVERVYIPKGVVEFHENIFDGRFKELTVYGQEGSRAEELAIQSGCEFIEVESGDEMP